MKNPIVQNLDDLNFEFDDSQFTSTKQYRGLPI